MTFVYTPPEPTAFIAEVRLWPSGKQHKMTFRGFTEAQLRSEVERARRETVEECAKVCDDYSGDKGTFFNFEFCDYVSNLFSLSIDKVFATFVSVKIARLAVLLSSKSEAKNESIEDSFDDSITYMAIWKSDYILRKKDKGNAALRNTDV